MTKKLDNQWNDELKEFNNESSIYELKYKLPHIEEIANQRLTDEFRFDNKIVLYEDDTFYENIMEISVISNDYKNDLHEYLNEYRKTMKINEEKRIREELMIPHLIEDVKVHLKKYDKNDISNEYSEILDYYYDLIKTSIIKGKK